MLQQDDVAAAAAPANSTMRVAFVYGRMAYSAVHRGTLPAAALGATRFRCGKEATFSDRRFDVVIHLKHVCHGALGLGAHHVFDHIDAGHTQLARFHTMSRNFTGEIMSSGPHIDHLCRTSVCTVIPHHYNLPCAPQLGRSNKTAVGLLGWNDMRTVVQQKFREAGIRTVLEPRSGFGFGATRARNFSAASCAFYSELGVAIAWNTPQNIYEPNQRFSNPIHLGIPTIGYAGQVRN